VQRIQRQKQQVPRAFLEETIHAITDTPLRDVLAVGFSIVGAKVLVGIFEYLEEIGAMDKVRQTKRSFFNLDHLSLFVTAAELISLFFSTLSENRN
jgi:hypothetical protein